MPTIRIDDEVMKALQKKAIPLVDTPNTVLRRILSIDKKPAKPAGRGNGTGERPRLPGGMTPNKSYRRPIVEALYEFGGRASAGDVLRLVERKMTLEAGDRARLKSGEVRWKRRANWERFNMVSEGLLKNDSPRGIWELAQAGVDLIEGRSGS